MKRGVLYSLSLAIIGTILISLAATSNGLTTNKSHASELLQKINQEHANIQLDFETMLKNNYYHSITNRNNLLTIEEEFNSRSMPSQNLRNRLDAYNSFLQTTSQVNTSIDTTTMTSPATFQIAPYGMMYTRNSSSTKIKNIENISAIWLGINFDNNTVTGIENSTNPGSMAFTLTVAEKYNVIAELNFNIDPDMNNNITINLNNGYVRIYIKTMELEITDLKPGTRTLIQLTPTLFQGIIIKSEAVTNAQHENINMSTVLWTEIT
ncbi:MAG: hypothetical protein J4432_02530 [DPANN group archaeon]|nr:hypothetical protein [DPANN group archaeon]